MSADNWAICPRCKDIAEVEKMRQHQEVASSYGIVPVAEFDALRAEANEPIDLQYTFREDYEIFGAEDGVVQVRYEGECQVCHVGTKFDFSQGVSW